ncbi:hypothetical protein EVAR_18426_1 [Eumeta japonica]|uniref:Uncharacterized protein n=1 Tax=Eumeta variegata TaxID=151549 RepID=A0A4C1UVC8_EUMVA|nr:hypothetical protein EVAR_18426_1 [Eumeta japonica]
MFSRTVISLCAVYRTKSFRSELPANDAMRRYNTPQPFFLLPRVPISRHCDAFVTNFAEAEAQPSSVADCVLSMMDPHQGYDEIRIEVSESFGGPLPPPSHHSLPSILSIRYSNPTQEAGKELATPLRLRLSMGGDDCLLSVSSQAREKPPK